MALVAGTQTLRRASSNARNIVGINSRALRWWIKKTFRTALVVGTSLVRAIVPHRRGGVRVLTYHRFGHVQRDPFCVSPEEFDQQMAWLAHEGRAISLDELDAFLRGERDLRPNAVLVTIDDGNPCVLSYAAPIAARHDIPLVSFVPAGELVRDGKTRTVEPESTDARLTEAELRLLASRGVVIGSHAWSHRSLARLPGDTQRIEAERSRAVLESLTGRPVTAFAYPFGTRADYDDRTTATLRAAGYRLAFTSQHGSITRDSDPLRLPRVKIEGGESLWMFRAIASGAMDGWRWVDHWLWCLQATP